MLKTAFNDIEHLLAKTAEYLCIPAVVGHEQFFMRHLVDDFRAQGRTVEHRQHVIVVHGKKPHSAIICAHVDRHGLISAGNGEFVYAATNIKEDKYQEFNVLTQAQVNGIAERFEGEHMVAYDPDAGILIGHGLIKYCRRCRDTGNAIFEVEGLDDLESGVPIAYERTATFENDYLKGQIDNALCVGVVSALFHEGFEGTALLTCEEEIGKSWVHIADYLDTEGLETQDLLVLDTSPFSDAEPIKGGRVIFRDRDFSAVFNTDLTTRLRERCKALGYPHYRKDKYLTTLGKTVSQLGSTELGRLIKHKDERWSGTTIQIPTLMYHTSRETTSRLAMQQYMGFLRNILIEDPIDLKITQKR